MKNKNFGAVVFLAVLFSLLVPARAFATLELSKSYKSVFGGEKPKCTTCHVPKLPKKEDGKHDLNEYGNKLKAAKASAQATVDEAVLKTVGKNPKAEY